MNDSAEEFLDRITAARAGSELLDHAAVMAKRDGTTRMWVVAPGKSAKLVRDGVSYARIDALTDGTFVTTLNGVRMAVPSWESCAAWMQAQACAAALTGGIWL